MRSDAVVAARSRLDLSAALERERETGTASWHNSSCRCMLDGIDVRQMMMTKKKETAKSNRLAVTSRGEKQRARRSADMFVTHCSHFSQAVKCCWHSRLCRAGAAWPRTGVSHIILCHKLHLYLTIGYILNHTVACIAGPDFYLHSFVGADQT